MRKTKPVFVDSFIYRGYNVQIEKWEGNSGSGYTAHYAHYGDTSSKYELAPFYDLEECESAVKKQINELSNAAVREDLRKRQQA